MSLNNILHVGPNLLPDLDCILLRFRLHPIVFCADLEKMFRQILVHPDDRDFQCILWRELGSSKIKIFRLGTVTYGTASAPYLAQRTLRQLVNDQVVQFPERAKILLEDIYMDDILSGAKNIDDAMVIIDQLSKLLKAGGFKTHKWMSNSNELLQALLSSLVSVKPDDYTLFNSIHLLLGLRWQPHPDQFKFQIKPFLQSSTVTKRSALSYVAQLFDPLGWLAPAKIFLQFLWLLKVSWDEPLLAPEATTWAHIADNLPALSQITVPRWMGYSVDASFIELHGFADASAKIYAAVVYLRT